MARNKYNSENSKSERHCNFMFLTAVLAIFFEVKLKMKEARAGQAHKARATGRGENREERYEDLQHQRQTIDCPLNNCPKQTLTAPYDTLESATEE